MPAQAYLPGTPSTVSAQDRWKEALDSGTYLGMPTAGPAGVRQAGGRPTFDIGNRQDLYDALRTELTDIHALPEDIYFTGQDIYDFFQRPEEVARMRDAERRYIRGYKQALERSQAGRQQELAKLGLGGWGTAIRQMKDAGKPAGGAAAGGLQSVMEAAAKEYDSPTRFAQIGQMYNDIINTSAAREQQTMAPALAHERVSSNVGGQLLASGNPFAMLASIAPLVSGTAITGAAETRAKKESEDARRVASSFGVGDIEGAKFRTPAYAPAGMSYSPYGSSQQALQRAYGGRSSEEETPYMYGA